MIAQQITPATLKAAYTAEFIAGVRIEVRNHRWTNPNMVAELTAIATALAVPDPTTHDTTIQAAPIAVRPALIPGPASGRSRFTNDVLLHVNQGKCYGQPFLTNVDMSNAITAALSNILPPVNTAAPAVTGLTPVGSTLSCTQGTWNFVPLIYRYQWLRAGVAIAGATNPTYVTVQADHLLAVSCMVTAENAAGATSIASNAISVA